MSWRSAQADGDLGGTMRLGAYPAMLDRGSRIAEIYGATEISERHRHRYEVNTAYKERAGAARHALLPACRRTACCRRSSNIADHPWFIGVQYHPELKSRPFEPHPLFASFIEAASGAEPAGLAGTQPPLLPCAWEDLREYGYP